MQVNVVHEFLIPCVEHTDEAELALDAPLRITSKDLQRFLDGCKQQSQHNAFIDHDQGIEFVRYGEDRVKIGTGQQLCLPVIEPFLLDQRLALGTVSVSAGVVSVTGVPAVITRFDMSAQCCGSTELDALHYLVLLSVDHVLVPVLVAISSK